MFRLLALTGFLFIAGQSVDACASFVIDHPDSQSLSTDSENGSVNGTEKNRFEESPTEDELRRGLLSTTGGMTDGRKGCTSGCSLIPPCDRSPSPAMIEYSSFSPVFGELSEEMPPSPINTLLRPPQSASSLIAC
ncbi:MAG: hypothetical protein GY768_10640 [Planctomycetaceae bacterium]|nr:hypothetical protein [Planctomycetaceae bacterium]